MKIRKIRIINSPKFIFTSLFILGGLIVLSLFISKSTLSHGETSYRKIYVSSGDTIWNIAEEERCTNKYYDNKDIRYIVENLKQTNNLNNSELKIGQELLIPII